jgi:hypothetical protein
MQGTELGTLKCTGTVWLTRGSLDKVDGGWTDANRW